MKIPMDGIKRIAAGVIAIFLVMVCGLSPAVSAGNNSAEKRTVRVGFAQVPGISETDQYGNRTGLMVDYLNEIAKYTDWEYEYVDVEGDEITNEFAAGKFDLMGGTYYAPGFEDYFAYPRYSMGNSRAALYCREDDSSVVSYELNSLNGKVIGVYKPAADKARRLQDFLQINNLSCELKYYTAEDMTGTGNLYSYLESGEIDLLLGSDLEAVDLFRVAASFDAQPYYIVTNLGNDELLDGLNMALGKILDSRPKFAEERYDANFQDLNTARISFNEEEKAYIAEKKTILVAVAENWHPFYCNHQEEDHHNGIIPDLVEQLSSYTGLTFDYIVADTYEEAIQLVLNGEADVLGGYMDLEESAFQNGLALTKDYVALNNIVLKNKAVDFPGTDLIAGVLNGRTLPSDIEAAEIRYFDTMQHMVEAVNRDEVDFIYGVSYAIEPILQNRQYLDVVPVARINNNMSVAMAMARPIDTNLMTILNKAIGSISEEEKSTIMDRNLVSMGYTSLSLGDLIYANPITFIVILGLVLVLLTTTFLLVAQSRVKNTLMRGELEKAEAKSRAKSDFLSRMSHEIRTPMNAIMGLSDITCMEEDLPPKTKVNLQKIRSSSQYLLSLINDILDMSRIENGRLEIDHAPFLLSGLLEELDGMIGAQAGQKQIAFSVEQRVKHDCLEGDSVRLRQVLTNLLSNAVKFTSPGGEVRLLVEEKAAANNAVKLTFSVKDNGVGIAPEHQKRIFDSFEQVGANITKSMGTGLGLPISSSIVQAMGGKLEVKSAVDKGSDFYFTLWLPVAEAPQEAENLPQERLEGIRVLLAEDNDLNAEIAVELLNLQGIQSQRVNNGQEAVTQFTQSAPGAYQLILMDIRMPVMDGLEATVKIRGSGHPDAATIPIVAMTANSFREDEEAARAAGMTGFVSKPVDLERLYEAIRTGLLRTKGK